MNRAEAAIELATRDRVTEPGSGPRFKTLQDGLVKAHAAYANLFPSVLGAVSQNEFRVIPRSSPVAGTVEAVRSALKARWFQEGNPLNIIPKAVTLATEGIDGVLQDAFHAGGSGNGYVITTAA